jgi:hypothetical protein
MDDLKQQEEFKPDLFRLLRRYGTPVLTSLAYRNVVPNSYDYPLDEICTMSVPMFGKPYLNNGVAQGIAYALYKGVKKLRIYGCDFTYPDRNFAETGRACVEAWIALASFHGMEVALSPGTSLYDTCDDHGIYGYAEQPPITLPDGTVFQYQKAEGATRGMYTPEDSSGVNNDDILTPEAGGTEGSSTATVLDGLPVTRHPVAPPPTSPTA